MGHTSQPERVDREPVTREEGHFDALVDAAPVMIWMAGPDKLCTFFNKPWLDFTGRTMAQELGYGWADGVHPDDLARCVRIYESAFEARKEFTMDYRLRRHDGVYRWILDNGLPYSTADGAFAGYVGSCVDITDRKQVEEELRDEEARYRAFFEVDVVGASEIALQDGRFIRVNDALCSITGYTRNELLRMCFSDVTHPEDRSQSLDDFERLKQGEQPSYSKVKRYLRPDGSIVWVRLAVSIVRDSHETPSHAITIALDITDRMLAAEALQKSNERYKLASASGQVGVWEWDADTDTIYAEDYALAATMGFEGRIGQTGARWLEAVHPDDRDRALAVWMSLVEGGADTVEFEYRVVNENGGVWWQNTRCMVTEREAGRARHIIGVTGDITKRRQTEDALRESEERYRAFFELNAFGAGEVDLDGGRFLRVNDALCEMTGYARDELLRMRFADLSHPDDLDPDWQHFERLLRGEIPDYRMEKRYIRKDGRIIWVQLAVTLIKDSSGNAVSELGLTQDITERKEAERDLQQLATRLLQSQDEERRRIARELHDDLAQTVLTINLNIAHVLEDQPAIAEQAKALLRESLELGDQEMEKIRTLSYVLHPPLLEELGLAAALEWYIDGFRRRSGIEVKLAISPHVGRSTPEVEAALFRIVQESLTNIHRHAGSERAWINLAKEDGHIVLTVRDQGSGMRSAEGMRSAGTESRDDIKSLGVGIPGMRQRMRQLSGELTIRTGSRGTTVIAVVPPDAGSSA
jgi:PAS domain S-box-containing protein